MSDKIWTSAFTFIITFILSGQLFNESQALTLKAF